MSTAVARVGTIEDEGSHAASGAPPIRRPDELLPYPGATFELLKLASGSVYRYTFEPGWVYSRDVPPEDGSVLCPEPHLMYHVSGRLGLRTDDGRTVEAQPGDVTSLPAHHDAWVIGESLR